MRNQHGHLDPSTWRDWETGTRVVVRRRLDDAEAAATGQRWTDVIGVVVSVDDAGVLLRRDPARPSHPAAGSEVRVAATEIEAAKRLPPRPTRRG